MAPKAGAASVQAGVSHWPAGNCRPIAERMTQRLGARGAGRGARRAARLPQRPRQARRCRRRLSARGGGEGAAGGSRRSGRPAFEPRRRRSPLTWGWALRQAGCGPSPRQSPGLRPGGGAGPRGRGGPGGRRGQGWPGAQAGRAAGGELLRQRSVVQGFPGGKVRC